MKGNRFLLILASGGMELSWRYAWATFLTVSILHHPFPFPETVGSFVLAAALASVYHERGWRVILNLCIQMAGFIPAAWRIIHVFNSWSDSFLSQAFKSYVGYAADQQGIPQEWMVVLLVLFWAIFIWGGGMGMAKRPRDYATICSRFDLGLGALFALFLVKFYMFLTEGKTIVDSSPEFLLFSFFIFGLLAIGLTRNRSRDAKDFMPGYRGLGVILSFIMTVLLFGAGLVFLALPYLTAAAQAGYGIMKGASAPLISLAMLVIHFLFGGKDSVSKSEPRPMKKMESASSYDLDSWWLQMLGEILKWVVLLLLLVILLTIAGVMLYSLVRWLFSKTDAGQKKRGLWDFLPLWTRGFRAFLHTCRKTMAGRRKTYRGAVQLYAELLIWGRRSGLPRSGSETPAEYGLRLKYWFPALHTEIDRIVEAFNREMYGEMVLGEQPLAMVRRGFRRLRSPLFWPSRVRSLLCRHPDQVFISS